MHIELWSIDRVKPYAGNPWHIPEAAVDKVADSIREFSWRQPIVVDAAGVIIAGHTRLLAARKLGLAQVSWGKPAPGIMWADAAMCG